MQLRHCFRFLFVASVFIMSASSARANAEVTLRASDGGVISGMRWTPAGEARAGVLLFHQAGSNYGEYAPIGPRLADLGYDVTAIDQRAGGNAFGRANATVAARGKISGFLAALPDLEAALADARQRLPGKPIVVVGSSYSAALVFLLAAGHPADVAAVVAFSPGEYLSGASVDAAAKRVTAPVFVTSAADSFEISAAADILAASPSKLKEQFVPKAGPHGASLLRADSNPEGSTAAWAALEAFLARVD
jgi:alpha-beta hydrolase superfamily lysophospholipase